MSRAAARLALLPLALACSLLVPAGPARASCAAVIEWRGVPYQPVQLRRGAALERGPRIGSARVPPCLDTFPAPEPPPRAQPVPARRIAGVRPLIAFFAQGAVWSAPGFFLELPGHPLHRAAFGDRPGVPNSTLGARCGRLSWVRGRVSGRGFGAFTLKQGRRSARMVLVDAFTGIAGFTRAGQPYLRHDEVLRVLAWHCRDAQSGRFLVARRVRPAP